MIGWLKKGFLKLLWRYLKVRSRATKIYNVANLPEFLNITIIANIIIIIDNEIDGEAFLLQSDDDIKDLVPLYGPRAKLIKKRNEANKVTFPASSSSSKCETCPIQVHTTVNACS